MNIHGYTALASGFTLLFACNGRLDVVEDEVGGGGANTVGTGLGMAGNGAETGGSSGAGGQGGNGGVEPNCQDGVKNAAETDLDCGGPDCPACVPNASCSRHEDCLSLQCLGAVCQASTCSDGVRNGDEEGVDCGGVCLASEPRVACPITLEACPCADSEQLTAVGCGPESEYPYAAVTPDGATVVVDFFRSTGGQNTFRWTAATGSVRLFGTGVLGVSSDGEAILLSGAEVTQGPGLWRGGSVVALPAYPLALSEDGRRVLGWNSSLSNWVWSEAGEVPIGEMNTPALLHWPTAMTPDAAVVVGARLTPGSDDAFRWTAGQFQLLGPRPVNALSARALAVSRNGSAVAGFTNAQPNNFGSQLELFHWTSEAGLTVVAPARSADPPFDVLLDDSGTVLVGTLGAAPDATSARAFRWTAEAGAVLLDTGADQTAARGMSADGSIVVGYIVGEQPFQIYEQAYPAFVWDAPSGLRRLDEVLQAAGVALDGWELHQPLAFSKNGRVVVGEGTCGGVPAVYRATLPD